MVQVLIQDIDDDIQAALLQRAHQHGWSVEDEIREILRRVVTEKSTSPTGLGSRIAARFADIGLNEELPELHGQEIKPVDFGS